MISQNATRLKDLVTRDPWLVTKYAVVTVALGVIGKAMLVGAKDGADVPTVYAQFVPTLPMMVLTFLAHRYLWGHRQAGFKSYIGKHWTRGYAVDFAAGHGLYLFFAVWLGLHYLGVSVVIGIASATAMFAYNEWRVFRGLKQEADKT